jgi:hypothetical protein
MIVIIKKCDSQILPLAGFLPIEIPLSLAAMATISNHHFQHPFEGQGLSARPEL